MNLSSAQKAFLAYMHTNENTLVSTLPSFIKLSGGLIITFTYGSLSLVKNLTWSSQTTTARGGFTWSQPREILCVMAEVIAHSLCEITPCACAYASCIAYVRVPSAPRHLVRSDLVRGRTTLAWALFRAISDWRCREPKNVPYLTNWSLKKPRLPY